MLRFYAQSSFVRAFSCNNSVGAGGHYAKIHGGLGRRILYENEAIHGRFLGGCWNYNSSKSYHIIRFYNISSSSCWYLSKEKDQFHSGKNRKFGRSSAFAAAFSPSSFQNWKSVCIVPGDDDTNWGNKFKKFPTRALIFLLLCSSAGVYGLVWSNYVEVENDDKRKREKLAWDWSPFVVSAAKPLDDDLSSKQDIKSLKNGAKGGGSRRQHFNFIADVLEIVQDAVVCIEVKDHSTTNWFGIPQGSSNGSGFIVKEDGLILTNAHVVASQQRNSITVKLHDGRCFAGYIEDVDYESDLATVRVKARGLPTLSLGCSSETRIGEWVVAVGSPLNLSNTVTAGVVSSTRRGANELGIHANDINYIQTDAAITFGNSGGPLINLDGEAIGINSMKVTPGISFAIPIDHAKKFLQRAELRKASGKSHASRRYMGLSILTMTEEIRKELESRTGISMNKTDHGVFVWQVVRGGPAFLSGIHPGDIITSINGKQVRSAAQVHDIVKTDDQLTMEVFRRGAKLTVIVVPENILQ